MTYSKHHLAMVIILLLFSVAGSSTCFGQNKFPDDWIGIWEGELRLERAGDSTRMKLPMGLHILPTDTPGTWSWTIIYGEGEKQDKRPYSLIAQDSNYAHFIIDEHNSIILDQYRVRNRMFSRFSVDSTLLTVIYRLDGDTLESEMWTGKMNGKITGQNLPEDTKVNQILAFPLGGVQISTLHRRKD